MKLDFNVAGRNLFFSLVQSAPASAIQHNPVSVQCHADLDCQTTNPFHKSDLIFNNIVIWNIVLIV